MPSPADSDKRLAAARNLAEGRTTLKEFRGYSDDALRAVAKQGIVLFQQGKTADARTLFQGLMAVNPRDAYFARLLGVAECAAGNLEGALAAFDLSLKLEGEEPGGYVGRAEVLLVMGQRARAVEDLKRAASLPGDSRLRSKAQAMLKGLRRR